MKCKGCGVDLYAGIFIVRCKYCSAKNTEKRKYKRRHEHRKKNAGLRK